MKKKKYPIESVSFEVTDVTPKNIDEIEEKSIEALKLLYDGKLSKNSYKCTIKF